MDARPLLERLAVLPTVAARDLYTDWVDESVDQRLVVAVLGRVDEATARDSSRLHANGGARVRLVLRTDTWASRSAAPAGPPATGWLRRAGGRPSASAGTRSRPAWRELGR